MSQGLHHTAANEKGERTEISEHGKQDREEVAERKKKFEGEQNDAVDKQEKAGDPRSAEIGRDPTTQSRDTIAQDAMLGEPKVSEEAWAGHGQDGPEAEELREQEVAHFIQEELYIHGEVSQMLRIGQC